MPPAIIVHSLRELTLAQTPGRPFTLLSAPGAARFGGCGWWAALIGAAGFTGPSLLDCGDAPGRAVEALRLGLPGIVLTCEAAAYASVAALAAAQAAVLLPTPPPALDLGVRGADRRLIDWLGGVAAAG